MDSRLSHIGTFAIGATIGIISMKMVEKYMKQPNSKVIQSNAVILKQDFVDIVEEPLSIDTLIEKVESPRAGAIVTFSGVTRDNFEGKDVIHLE